MIIALSIVIGFVGMFATLIYYSRVPNNYDWVERLARSLFAWLQCALWGAVVVLLVMVAAGVEITP